MEKESLIGHPVDLFYRQVAAVGNGLGRLTPDVVHVGLDLLAIGIAQLVQHIGLDRPFVGAHFEDLHLDTHLLQQPFVEEVLGGESGQFQ